MLGWFSWWDFGLLILFLITLLLVHGYWAVGSFKRKGIKCIPAYPIVGNSASSLFQKIHFMDSMLEFYLAFPNEKYMGVYQFQKPNLLLRDIELIKQIAIKDFDNFHDHQKFIDDKSEPLFAKTLVALQGQKWRDMRATLSPAFTSSKIRNMFAFIDECAEHMSDFFIKKMKEDSNQKNGYIEIEMKDTFTRFANDVIATTAFGIEVDSLSNQNNEFYIMGKNATNFSVGRLLKSFMLLVAPWIVKIFKLKVFDERISDFFRDLINNQMKYREENNVIRPDMIHLLMEAKKGTLVHDADNEGTQGFATVEESTIGQKIVKRKWDDDEIVAQALLFFFAGFDTSSTVLTLMSHELTINEDVQNKLQHEIDDVLKSTNGKPTYNDIQNMKYMDMVVSETLRKWPPGPITDRVCVKPYTLPPSSPGAKPYMLNAGDVVWIPIYPIHRDPKYYPNPNKFDPERFSDENKGSIAPFTYLPFGTGPRNCIGSRFALLEMKLVIFHLLAKFDFVHTPKTTKPLILDRKVFTISAEGKTWLGLKPRIIKKSV